MINNSLSNLLLSLSTKERTEFERLLNARSSWLSIRSEVLPLYTYLAPFLDKGIFPDRQTIHRALFPDEAENDQRIRRYMSYLKKSLERFIAIQEVMQQDSLTDQFLLQAYRKRGLNSAFESASKRFQKRNPSLESGNENDQYNAFKFHLEQYNYYAGRTGQGLKEIPAILDSLDKFYIINQLKQACSILTHQRISSFSHPMPILETLLPYIEASDLLKVPSISIHFNSLMTLRPIANHEEGEQYFRNLKRDISNLSTHFKQEELRQIYTIAINYCIRQLNIGKRRFLREVFDLYKSALQAQILLHDGQLSHLTYKNIVSAALKLGEFTWTDGFLHQYKAHLELEHQEDSFRYNLSKLNFSLGKFREAIALLNRHQTDDLFTQLDSRLLMIKSYYELGEFDFVEYQMDAFRQLIRRQKHKSYHLQHYQSFLKLMRGLILQKPPTELIKAIGASEAPAENEWLLEKVQELKG